MESEEEIRDGKYGGEKYGGEMYGDEKYDGEKYDDENGERRKQESWTWE